MPLPPRVVILSIAKDLAVVLAWRVNDGSCAWPRKLALLRAAAPTLVILSAAKDLALVPARQDSLVPCGCRRAGYFPLGESNQSRPRDGLRPAARGALRCSLGALSAFASCFAAKPGPRHPGACAQRMRCARRELAHPWARTGAPFPRTRLRCSALANAGKVNSNRASARWPWFLIFIPLRQRRDCAGKARSVSARTRSRAAGHGWPSARPAQARGPAQRALRSGSAFFGSFLCRPKERNPRGGSRTEQGKLAMSRARTIVHAPRRR